MDIGRKQEIKNEMMSHLAEQLETFWVENYEVTTTDSWGDHVTFRLDSETINTATERILRAAEDRLVLVFLNENNLSPEGLDQFAERWLKEAQGVLEEHADAVAAEV